VEALLHFPSCFFYTVQNYVANSYQQSLHCCISGVGGGAQGVQVHPQKFPYVENSGKILENPGKICVNLRKICENLCKIPENLDKNGAQRCLI